jgi:hypothetical protein
MCLWLQEGHSNCSITCIQILKASSALGFSLLIY